jgi:hypothetical protein
MKRRSTAIAALIVAPALLVLAIVPAPPAALAARQAPAPAVAAAAQSTPTPSPPVPPGMVLLDGVELNVDTPFLPGARFGATEPDNAIQVAAAIERTGLYREFSITAAPFGTSPPTEALPPAEPGGAKAYRSALFAFRQQQGADPQPGPVVTLFGQKVAGAVSVVDLHVGGLEPRPVAIAEWVVEAGERLWIVRASQALSAAEVVGERKISLPLLLEGTVVTSPDPRLPSTSAAAAGAPPEPALAAESADQASRSVANDLPNPPWWNGETCDFTHYWLGSAGTASYALGAVYRNLTACGPRPGSGGVWVEFFPGARQQLEWQCPELSKRFLYLAYGIEPYGANGSQVVWNYGGDQLEKISNGTAGIAPQPDDVLSYGSTSTWGHTSVVSVSNVDASGNGEITVIEQNASLDGDAVLQVRNWEVRPSWTYVSGWLHDPSFKGRLVLVLLIRRFTPTASPEAILEDTPTPEG